MGSQWYGPKSKAQTLIQAHTYTHVPPPPFWGLQNPANQSPILSCPFLIALCAAQQGQRWQIWSTRCGESTQQCRLQHIDAYASASTTTPPKQQYIAALSAEIVGRNEKSIHPLRKLHKIVGLCAAGTITEVFGSQQIVFLFPCTHRLTVNSPPLDDICTHTHTHAHMHTHSTWLLCQRCFDLYAHTHTHMHICAHTQHIIVVPAMLWFWSERVNFRLHDFFSSTFICIDYPMHTDTTLSPPSFSPRLQPRAARCK